MKKIFIIGNGPSATQHKIGDIIDAADVVVRINDFKTSGFEEYVGTRTDILFTCRLNEYLDNLHTFPEVILSLLMNPLEGVTIPDSLLESTNISDIIDWPEVLQFAKKMRFTRDAYPSTGLICILKMIARFGTVGIIGFDNFKNGNRHYYEIDDRKAPPRHNGKREKGIISILKNLGLLYFIR